MDLSDISIFLPKYLSGESQRELFEDIKKFISTESIGKYYASEFVNESVMYQGGLYR